jgi:hypothetical protein
MSSRFSTHKLGSSDHIESWTIIGPDDGFDVGVFPREAKRDGEEPEAVATSRGRRSEQGVIQ